MLNLANSHSHNHRCIAVQTIFVDYVNKQLIRSLGTFKADIQITEITEYPPKKPQSRSTVLRRH